jgi:hypothetical protein
MLIDRLSVQAELDFMVDQGIEPSVYGVKLEAVISVDVGYFAYTRPVL